MAGLAIVFVLFHFLLRRLLVPLTDRSMAVLLERRFDELGVVLVGHFRAQVKSQDFLEHGLGKCLCLGRRAGSPQSFRKIFFRAVVRQVARQEIDPEGAVPRLNRLAGPVLDGTGQWRQDLCGA